MEPLQEPVEQQKLKALVREILDDGNFEISSHAYEELAKDDLDAVDAVNVLRGGWFEAGEWEKGQWRYKARTSRICVVFCFGEDARIIIVTGWRERR